MILGSEDLPSEYTLSDLGNKLSPKTRTGSVVHGFKIVLVVVMASCFMLSMRGVFPKVFFYITLSISLCEEVVSSTTRMLTGQLQVRSSVTHHE